MSSEQEIKEKLLAQHKEALTDYRRWDGKVKQLLKGRRAKDLSPEDMETYRDVAERRDLAYDKMRHLERTLLDNIPGASTGPLPRIKSEDLTKDKDQS
jgi:hypothetical protein